MFEIIGNLFRYGWLVWVYGVFTVVILYFLFSKIKSLPSEYKYFLQEEKIQEKDKNIIFSILRWIVVIPISIALGLIAFRISNFIIDILYTYFYPISQEYPIPQDLPNLAWQATFGVYFFVSLFIAYYIAPSYKNIAGIIISLLSIGIYVFAILWLSEKGIIWYSLIGPMLCIVLCIYTIYCLIRFPKIDFEKLFLD